MNPKPKTLKAILPNKGVEVAYRKALKRLLAQIQDEAINEIEQCYQSSTKIAQDAGLNSLLRLLMKRLMEKWQNKLDRLAPQVAEIFAKSSGSHTDRAMMNALKKAGFTVGFRFSPRQQEAYQAVLGENVALITKMTTDHLQQIEQIVWRAVASGHNLKQLSGDLQNRFEMSKRRADFIARDQNHKAKATIEQARRLDLGITEAIWQHSTAGKHPRKSHVSANGKKFDIAKGCYIDGEYILPGQLINCLCTSRAVLPWEMG